MLLQVSMQEGIEFSEIYSLDSGWEAWSGDDIDTPTPEKEIPDPPLPSFTTASTTPTATSPPTNRPESISSTPVATEDAPGFGMIGALIGMVFVCILTITRRKLV